MGKKLVSVIIPVYNVENYLDRCIESIVNQTYEELEIILVNDGSMDRSKDICCEWEKKDKRIVVVDKTNGGLSDARNYGMKNAHGSYYSFVDSDDYLSLDAVESFIESLDRYDADISICNMIRFNEKGETSPFYKTTESDMCLSGDDRYRTLLQPSVCNKMFKANLFEGVLFPFGKYYEDTFVYHDLLYKADKVCFTGKDSYWYLQRSDSIVGGNTYTVRYFDFIEAVYNRAKFLTNHHLHPYGEEACLSLYAAMSNAEKMIPHNLETNEKFTVARKQYAFAFDHLLKESGNISLKQKLRLVLLKYYPALHSWIY